MLKYKQEIEQMYQKIMEGNKEPLEVIKEHEHIMKEEGIGRLRMFYHIGEHIKAK